MIKHGEAPFLECSSKGDKRFSAFNARLRAHGNKSIEDIYQAAKIFEDGITGRTWREAKGKKAVNADAVRVLYGVLWDAYIDENPDLIEVLKAATGVSDLFGQAGHACQATELWRIRNEALRLDDAEEFWRERTAILIEAANFSERKAEVEAMRETIERYGKPLARQLANRIKPEATSVQGAPKPARNTL